MARQGKSRARQGKSRQDNGKSRQWQEQDNGKTRQIKRGDILPVIMLIFKSSHQFLCRSQYIRTNVSITLFFSFLESYRSLKSFRENKKIVKNLL